MKHSEAPEWAFSFWRKTGTLMACIATTAAIPMTSLDHQQMIQGARTFNAMEHGHDTLHLSRET